MYLRGQLSANDKVFMTTVAAMMKNMSHHAARLRPHVKRQAVEALLACAASYHASIGHLINRPMTSSAAVFSLTRSVLESALSMLAFCKDPDSRSSLYINFAAVLDWKTAVRASWHIGQVFLPDTQEYRQGLTKNRKAAEKKLRRFGRAYMKKKGCTQDDLEEAIAGEKVNKFRDKWYPEGPRELLGQYDLEWVYDVLYKTFCSHVHADIGSIGLFSVADKSTASTNATCMMLLGLRWLVSKLDFRLSNVDRYTINTSWRTLTDGDTSGAGKGDS